MSGYEDLDKISPARKRDVLLTTADMGKAAGMRAGVEILRDLAKGRESVSAGELMAAAATLEDAAAKVDAAAQSAIKSLLSSRSDTEGR